MAAIEAVAADAPAPDRSLRLTLARILLTPLCAALIAVISFRDFLAAALGDDLVPRIQLHLQFNSQPFLFLFLPCTFILYALYRRTAFANWILTLAGLAFYATAGLIYLVPLVFTCVFDYLVGAYLARDHDERRRKLAFVASVAIQLSLLSAFKYAGWLSSELAGLFAALGIGLTFAPLALPLPPGISFYTFHTISYTADIYRRKFRPRGRLIDYLTFVGFFPQLIAGPIARASELLPQVAATRPGGLGGAGGGGVLADRLGPVQENIARRQLRSGGRASHGRTRPSEPRRRRLYFHDRLRRADLLRFFRLYRHRPRRRQAVRHRAAAQFPRALFRHLAFGVLAALAHLAVALAARLSLHPAWRRARGPAENAAQSRHHHVPRRAVARRRLRIHRVGSLSRRAASVLSVAADR